MLRIEQYPPAVGELLIAVELQPLDAGTPREAVRQKLARLTPAEVVGKSPTDENMARACLAGLWLAHNFLDESHAVSQEIHTPTGSFWHAVMHRREGDFSNAKYWFRRVDEHPVFASLHHSARRLFEFAPSGPEESTRDLPPKEVLTLLAASKWDPFQFVDAVESAGRRRLDIEAACRRVQQAEWELLFNYCFTEAGRTGR